MDFTELFCDVDDFCKVFQPRWEQRQITSGERRRKHRPQLSLSEQMTIVIAFHASNYRDFKHFYLTSHVSVWRNGDPFTAENGPPVRGDP